MMGLTSKFDRKIARNLNACTLLNQLANKEENENLRGLREKFILYRLK